LIQIVPKYGKPFLARMIDEYPAYADPLPDELQLPGSSFSIKLQRAAFCDQDPRERVQDRRDRISVGSVAHDLSEGASQFPSIHQSPVRCFIATPGSWKNPKGIQKDEW
jgi:hypothetical protein